MEDTVDQNASCRRLLAAVVALAVKDACQPSIRVRSKETKMYRRVPTEAASSAIHFLFGKGVIGYLQMLDMDTDRWRLQLMDQMNAANVEVNSFNSQISAFDKRCFGWNHWWVNAHPNERMVLSDEEIDGKKPVVETQQASV